MNRNFGFLSGLVLILAACGAETPPMGPVCGDARVDVGEACDDGNTSSGDGCSGSCTSDESCGNSIVDTVAGEACDDGNTADADGCSSECALPSCGDGSVDAGEACDDGNTIAGDGCSATCMSDESCGNGVVDTGEGCDDGNTAGGDGCDAACVVEPSCGDGNVDEGEGCDDGNVAGGDGCSATCMVEASCGDGALDEGEGCDDGNLVDGDGCSASCVIESRCGDGVVDEGEACDDGNTEPGDGCDALCGEEAATEPIAGLRIVEGPALSDVWRDDVVGFRVVVGATPMQVTSLGFYDAEGDGLAYSHRVGIYAVEDGSSVVSATVPAGTVAPLVDGFRYVELEGSFTLAAGATYVVLGYRSLTTGDVPQDAIIYEVAGIEMAEGLTYVTQVAGNDFGELVYVNTPYPGVTNGWFGPNLMVR